MIAENSFRCSTTDEVVFQASSTAVRRKARSVRLEFTVESAEVFSFVLVR